MYHSFNVTKKVEDMIKNEIIHFEYVVIKANIYILIPIIPRLSIHQPIFIYSQLKKRKMGNSKSTSHISNISSPKSRQSRGGSTSDSVKLPTVIPRPKRSDLSERDIAFLCSQTGKYFELINFSKTKKKYSL